MGDPSGPELRRREVLESLDRHDVQFILVGGQAAASHGALRPTRDLDICVLWTPENLDRLGAVLDQFDAGLRLTGEDEPIAVPHRDGRFLIQMDLSTWRSTAGDIDVLRSLPAPGGAELRYERLLARAIARPCPSFDPYVRAERPSPLASGRHLEALDDSSWR